MCLPLMITNTSDLKKWRRAAIHGLACHTVVETYDKKAACAFTNRHQTDSIDVYVCEKYAASVRRTMRMYKHVRRVCVVPPNANLVRFFRSRRDKLTLNYRWLDIVFVVLLLFYSVYTDLNNTSVIFHKFEP